MKKVFMTWMTLCLTVVALACGSNDPEVDGITSATEQNGESNGSATGKKSLVIFFSRAGENWQVGNVERGNTAIMVDYIQEFADVDVFEIVPETPYPSNYMECVNYVNDVEIPQNLRPAYKGDINNLADYDNIFIGGPIWCGQPPYIFRTFFEKHAGELNGKTVIPFGTHGGSGVGSYTTLIKGYYPNATILESLGISGSSIRNESSKTTVKNWLNRLGFDKQSTAVRSVSTRNANNGVSYTLTGQLHRSAEGRLQGKNGQPGIYIQNGKKVVVKRK
jgi:flavodoxin